MFFREYSELALSDQELNYVTSAEHLPSKTQGCPWIPSVFDERAKRIWASLGLCAPNVDEIDDTSSSNGEQGVEGKYALGQSTASRFFNTYG